MKRLTVMLSASVAAVAAPGVASGGVGPASASFESAVEPALVRSALVRPAVVRSALVRPALVRSALVRPAVVRSALVRPAVVRPAKIEPMQVLRLRVTNPV